MLTADRLPASRWHGTAFALLATALITPLHAQQTPPIQRTVVLKQDMTLPGREAVVATIELAPGAAEGRHTHPAELYVYLIEGEIVLESEGRPDRLMKAGDAASVAPGKIHQAINRSNAPAKGVAVFIAEKGKPLAGPAP